MTDDETNKLVELLKPFWSAQRTIEALGLASAETLVELAESGRLLALPTADDQLIVPTRQFVRAGGRVVLRPGLAGVLNTLRAHDPWAVALVVLVVHASELDAVPVDVADGSHDGALLTLAKRISREWSDGRPAWYADAAAVDVLQGRVPYDDADRETQELVRRAWDERATAARITLNLAAEFESEGRPWSELDDDGHIVRRNASPP